MITLNQIGPNGRDGTARYYVDVDYEYKVGEFIKSVLNERRHEWGEITIKPDEGKKEWQDIILSQGKADIYSCEYAYGRLKSKLKKNVLEKNIVCICAYGGYSFMNYVLVVEK